MKRIFLRFPSHIRKRDLVILMLLIFILCFVRLDVSNGSESKISALVKVSSNIDQIQKLENVSDMKLTTAVHGGTVNITNFTSPITTEHVTTKPTRQSLINEFLSHKNYRKLCGNDKQSPIDIERSDDLLQSNSSVDCSRKSFVLFVVLSHISNLEFRDKIRQSWASIRQLQSKKITVLFFLYSDRDYSEQEKRAADKERDLNRDTLLLLEKYSLRNEVNLYIKMFQFLIFDCEKPEYFVFVNDGTFVNIPTLFEALLTHKDISKESSHVRSLFLCKVKKNSVVTRNNKSAWYVTKEEWPGKHYPPHCDMPQGMVISYDILRDMFVCSLYNRSLWIADVFVTGILPEKLELSPEDFLEDFSTNSMRNHYIEGDLTHNVFLVDGHRYNHRTWRLIFNRSLREL